MLTDEMMPAALCQPRDEGGCPQQDWGFGSCSSLCSPGLVSRTTCLSKKSVSCVEGRSVNPKEYKGEQELST